MFKSATAYFNPAVPFEILEQLQQTFPAADPQPTQPMHTGIANVEQLSDTITLLTLKTVKRVVPSSVVKRTLAEKVEAFTESYGYAPGRKMQRELKEQVIMELLPKAFLSESLTRVLFTPQHLIIENRIDPTLEFLCHSLKRMLESDPLSTLDDYFSPKWLTHDFNKSVSEQLSFWLTDETPEGLHIAERVKVTGENGRTVDFRKLGFLEPVLKVLNTERYVSEMELLSEETRFVLTDRLELKGIKYPKSFKNNEDHGEAYLIAQELVKTFNQLIEVLK